MIETRARETGYPRYALPVAEVVSIAASSSSVSSSDTDLNFEHLDENSHEEALEEPREQGRNNSYDENDPKEFNEIKLISILQRCLLDNFLMQQAVLVPLETKMDQHILDQLGASSCTITTQTGTPTYLLERQKSGKHWHLPHSTDLGREL